MTYQSLFMLATAGFTLMATFFLLERYERNRARSDHYRAKLRGHVLRAYVKAEKMVQHRDLTPEQTAQVYSYLDILETAHRNAGFGSTERFNRLRQTLIRNNRGVRVVV